MGFVKNAFDNVKSSAWGKVKSGATKVCSSFGNALKFVGKKALVIGGIAAGVSVGYELYKDIDPFKTQHKIRVDDDVVAIPEFTSDNDGPEL